MKKNNQIKLPPIPQKQVKLLSRFAGIIIYAILLGAEGIFLLFSISGIANDIFFGVASSLLCIVTAIFISHFCYHMGYKINYIFGIIVAIIGAIYSIIFFITMYVLKYYIAQPDIYKNEISFCVINMIISWCLGIITSIVSPLPDLPDKELSR